MLKSETLLSLSKKPWDNPGTIVDQSIFQTIGMIGPEERRCYYWLASNWLSDRGCIVDAGSFLGASTRSFAAGASAAGRVEFGGRPLVHAYDYFEVVDDYVGETIAKNFRPIAKGDSYLDIFELQTAPVQKSIEVHSGDFLSHKWNGNPIEILFIDIAKTDKLNSHVIGELFPSLMPNHSLVIHQDYYHCWHPYIHIGMEYFSDEFELVDEYVSYQSRIWRLTKPLSPEKIGRLEAYDLSKRERLDLLNRVVEKASEFSRPMMEVVRVWQFCLDEDYSRAKAELASLRRRFDVDNRREIWFQQVREIETFIS